MRSVAVGPNHPSRIGLRGQTSWRVPLTSGGPQNIIAMWMVRLRGGPGSQGRSERHGKKIAAH